MNAEQMLAMAEKAGLNVRVHPEIAAMEVILKSAKAVIRGKRKQIKRNAKAHEELLVGIRDRLQTLFLRFPGETHVFDRSGPLQDQVAMLLDALKLATARAFDPALRRQRELDIRAKLAVMLGGSLVRSKLEVFSEEQLTDEQLQHVADKLQTLGQNTMPVPFLKELGERLILARGPNNVPHGNATRSVYEMLSEFYAYRMSLEQQLADIELAFGNAFAFDDCKTLAEKAQKCMRNLRQQNGPLVVDREG